MRRRAGRVRPRRRPCERDNEMDREKIILYSEKKDNLGAPETFLGRGEAREPGCGDVLAMFVNTSREIITECRFTITESACPPLKACAARAADLALGKPVMEAYLISAAVLSEFFGGLEKESAHCAQMAEIALKQTLKDYAVRRAARMEQMAVGEAAKA